MDGGKLEEEDGEFQAVGFISGGWKKIVRVLFFISLIFGGVRSGCIYMCS